MHTINVMNKNFFSNQIFNFASGKNLSKLRGRVFVCPIVAPRKRFSTDPEKVSLRMLLILFTSSLFDTLLHSELINRDEPFRSGKDPKIAS